MIPDRNEVCVEEQSLERDKPHPNEVLLETLTSFISTGTELAIYTGLDPDVDREDGWCRYPFKPGYANVARIVAVGDEVDDVSPGERLFTMHGHCSHHFCRINDGELHARVPAELDNAVAAAARMAMVSIAAVHVADLQLNDRVVVFGLGPVGNLACQLFRLSGARVIGIDPVQARRRLARTTGTDNVVGADDNALEAVLDITGGEKPHITVDAVGDAHIVRQAMELTARHGEVILLGSPRAAAQDDLLELVRPVHLQWITLKGALEWRVPFQPTPHVRTSIKQNVHTIFDLVARKRLQMRPLISHRLPADQIKRAYRGLQNQKNDFWGVALEWTD